MPKDSIARAILKGTGQLEGVRLEDVVYEGYGVGGVAIYVEAITDNRNRTAPEIRKIFEGAGGSLGGPGTVAWMFEKKGVLSVSADAVDEDKLMEIVLEARVEDMQKLDDLYEITTAPSSFTDVKTALVESEIDTETAELANVATQNVTPSPAEARRILRLMEQLEDHDDVQNVSANIEITPELVAAMDEDE